MARISKSRGTSFEYRVRDLINSITNWESERNPLSGASDQICKTLSKHDVRAYNKNINVKLQLECKKTAKDALTIQKEWLDKINFENHEYLVISFNRSPCYILFPTSDEPTLTFNGKSSFKFNSKDCSKNTVLSFNSNCYKVDLLEDFILTLDKSSNKNKESIPISIKVEEERFICPHCEKSFTRNDIVNKLIYGEV